jgi:DNA-binding GntR family transcriptional regulator
MVSPMAPLDERLALAIEDRIVSGELAGGERLRQETLAAEFGVSHIPVREALRKLAARGFVTLHPRRGASVTSLTSDEIVQHLDVRVLLETTALRYALPLIGADEVRAARAAIAALDGAPDSRNWPELNWQFHSAIYRACNRPVLLELIEQLHNDARSKRFHHLVTLDVAESSREHRRLLSLIEKRDAEAAIRLLKRHIGVTSSQLKSLLKGLEPGS